MTASRTALAAVILTIFGGLLLALGFVIEGLVHTHLQSKVPDFVSLTNNNSATFRVWAGGPDGVQQYVSFYFFNVSNVNSVISRLAVPHLDLVGPFTYTIDEVKFNISLIENGTALQYLRNGSLTFYDAPCPANASFHWTGGPPCSMSNDTVIFTANVPLLAIIEQINMLSPLQEELVTLFIDFINKRFGNEDLMPALAVADILFGYNDTVMQGFDEVIAEYNKLFNASLVMHDPFFALQRPGSLNYSRISTAPTTPGHLSMWNGYEGHVDFWGNGSCGTDGPTLSRQANAINGTDGSLFEPSPPDTLQLFSPSLFRSVLLHYTSDSSYEDIPALRYTIDQSIFANVTQEPGNCVFDAPGLFGVLNITDIFGTPLYVSNPLFAGADPGYLANVTGLDRYVPAETVYDVDPWTGVTLRSHTRLQLNARITPWERLAATRWVRPGGFYLPVLVVEQRAVVGPAFLEAWQSEFGTPLNAAASTRLAGFIVGAFLLAVALSVATVSAARCHYSPESDLMLPESEPLLAHIDINA